jgi:DNA-binding NtrC family response regulator
MPRVLVVDDDTELRETITEVMQKEGMHTVSSPNAEEGLKQLQQNNFDIVLLDVIMPKMNGIDAIPLFIKAQPKAKIIIMTAYSTVDTAVEAMKKGAADYLTKPFKITELMITIRRIVEEQRFKDCAEEMDIDCALSTMANPIRRQIIHMIEQNQSMRFMEITRTLGIEDHTKVNFHLKVLKESEYICQDGDKAYIVTDKGNKILSCLSIIENNLK